MIDHQLSQKLKVLWNGSNNVYHTIQQTHLWTQLVFRPLFRLFTRAKFMLLALILVLPFPKFMFIWIPGKTVWSEVAKILLDKTRCGNLQSLKVCVAWLISLFYSTERVYAPGTIASDPCKIVIGFIWYLHCWVFLELVYNLSVSGLRTYLQSILPVDRLMTCLLVQVNNPFQRIVSCFFAPFICFLGQLQVKTVLVVAIYPVNGYLLLPSTTWFLGYYLQHVFHVATAFRIHPERASVYVTSLPFSDHYSMLFSPHVTRVVLPSFPQFFDQSSFLTLDVSHWCRTSMNTQSQGASSMYLCIGQYVAIFLFHQTVAHVSITCPI